MASKKNVIAKPSAHIIILFTIAALLLRVFIDFISKAQGLSFERSHSIQFIVLLFLIIYSRRFGTYLRIKDTMIIGGVSWGLHGFVMELSDVANFQLALSKGLFFALWGIFTAFIVLFFPKYYEWYKKYFY